MCVFVHVKKRIEKEEGSVVYLLFVQADIYLQISLVSDVTVIINDEKSKMAEESFAIF